MAISASGQKLPRNRPKECRCRSQRRLFTSRTGGLRPVRVFQEDDADPVGGAMTALSSMIAASA